mmetsp:Transcript_33132/g.72192  ORF Transcript_33132/g.72192 Transcript_33132/m.72192 type:complete len:280 (-) Transcript_33132:438-1277(-)
MFGLRSLRRRLRSARSALRVAATKLQIPHLGAPCVKLLIGRTQLSDLLCQSVPLAADGRLFLLGALQLRLEIASLLQPLRKALEFCTDRRMLRLSRPGELQFLSEFLGFRCLEAAPKGLLLKLLDVGFLLLELPLQVIAPRQHLKLPVQHCTAPLAQALVLVNLVPKFAHVAPKALVLLKQCLVALFPILVSGQALGPRSFRKLIRDPACCCHGLGTLGRAPWSLSAALGRVALLKAGHQMEQLALELHGQRLQCVHVLLPGLAEHGVAQNMLPKQNYI